MAAADRDIALLTIILLVVFVALCL